MRSAVKASATADAPRAAITHVAASLLPYVPPPATSRPMVPRAHAASAHTAAHAAPPLQFKGQAFPRHVTVAFSKAAYVPGAHATHAVAPEAPAALPAAHGAQKAAAAAAA